MYKEPKYLVTADKKVVLVYDSIDDAPIHPDTPLENVGSLSDGYHTYDELYEFRKMYNALVFNAWAGYLKWNPDRERNHDASTPCFLPDPQYSVHKSWKHHDGELAFGGGWFIVSAMLPTGLISNHYKAKDWDLFQVPEVEKALFEFDGHTGADVLQRLKALTDEDAKTN